MSESDFSFLSEVVRSEGSDIDLKSRDFDSAVKMILEDGYKLSNNAISLSRLLYGRRFKNPNGRECGFSPLYGLGHYDDLVGWMEFNNIDLFPIGFWSDQTIYMGSDEEIYLSDPDNTVVSKINGRARAILSLIQGPRREDISPIPPTISYGD